MTAGPITSENAILDLLGRYFPLRKPGILVGRGDDCALLPRGKELAVSTDLFLEDTHFRLSWSMPDEIGHKALACNISDLAACGARPLAFVLALGVPKNTDPAWLNAFFSGMGALASSCNMALIGGDLSASEKITVSITVFGEVAGETAFLSRGGSMPGDALFVVGDIGLARVGLCELEKNGRKALESWPRACEALLKPKPRVDAGLMLARVGHNARPPALMDLSDGLARDLPRLLGLSGEDGVWNRENRRLGAELLVPAGLLHGELVAWCRQNGKNPVHEAILGGDDYALLGSCAPDMLPSLHAAIPGFREIGVVTEDEGLICNNEPMTGLHGFDHFAG